MKTPVGTVLCEACGGGAPETATVCPYCGAKVPVPAAAAAVSTVGTPPIPKTYCPRCAQFHLASLPGCPRCPPASPGSQGGRCPRCKIDLASTSVDGATLDACPACKALWFDAGEIERLLDLSTKGRSLAEVESLRAALPRIVSPIEKGSLECVRCRAPMIRRQIALKSGVVVDVCRTHGIWFDRGEWEHFGSFVRAGGLEVDRRDEDAARAKGLPGRTGRMSGRTYFPGDEKGGAGFGVVMLEALAVALL